MNSRLDQPASPYPLPGFFTKSTSLAVVDQLFSENTRKTEIFGANLTDDIIVTVCQVRGDDP